MVQFNELRIDSNQNLIIDASVLDITDDPNGYAHINHVYVGIGSNCELVDLIDSPFVTRLDDSTGYLRGIRVVVDLNNAATKTLFNLECTDLVKQLFYVKVDVDITNPVVVLSDCTMLTYVEGYAYDRCLLLNKLYDYLKQSNDICSGIDDFANYVVKVNGLQLAVESGNFTLASTYWNEFFANNNSNVSLNFKSDCKCHQ